jgi:pSer/pThr/pTyr-binding forkhead associated (FHA) protein
MGDEQQGDAEPSEGRLLGRVKLVVEQGMILGEQFLLNDQELLIGRFDASSGHCPDIDLSAQDPSFVHRRHARLEFSSNGERLTLFDLGGRNGAYVNNRPVEQNGAAPIRIGDKVRIGRVVMRLQPTEEAETYDRGR